MRQTNEYLKNQSQSISERNKNETFLEVIIIKVMVKDFMISPFKWILCTRRHSIWIHTYIHSYNHHI